MKRILIIFALILALMTNLFSFIDEDEEEMELLERKLDDLKAIEGILFSGRGKIYYDSARGDGQLFKTIDKRVDYNQLVQLDLNFLGRPLQILEGGGSMRFETDVSENPWETESKIFKVRDLYAEIVLLEFIEIRFGTLYERLTPFTLYAPIDIIPLRSELFFNYYQNDIYDNYLHNHPNFPLEGLRVQFELIFPNIGSYKFKTIVAQLDGTGFAGNSYERFLFGVMNTLKYNKAMQLDLTWTSIQDLKETGSPVYNHPLLNNVYSARGELDAVPLLFTDKSPIKSAGIEGELAMSTYNSNILDSSLKATNGYANEIAGFVNYNDIAKIRGGYRAIEYNYVAPGAQTGLAFPGGESITFQGLGLPGFAFDYYYQHSVRISRNYWNPLNFTFPMNTATPNRAGLFADINANLGVIRTFIEVNSMEEMAPVPWPTDLKRKFSRLTGEISLPLGEFLNIRLLPEISGFYIEETVDRDDALETSGSNLIEAENFKSKVTGGEVKFSPLANLALIGMYQEYKVNGKKIIDLYSTHKPLRIDGYLPAYYAYSESVYGVGLIYSMSKTIFIQSDYLIKEYNYSPQKSQQFTLNHFRAMLSIIL